ncbi:DUF4367 domain-containing protein [Paenibacillus macerans]|uniref:DUF4367 domain-containing protein n=1 Tax=Paenibacillus macerans TaxID=44252 RepID=UPI002E1AFD3E|nr:DUF4367 domain-containing protein [Paenibacillus macerans]
MISDKDQDLKQLFREAQLPEVDLTPKVMSKLRAEKKTKARLIGKRKVGLLVMAGMLLAASTAFAASNYYYALKSKHGDIVWEEKILDKSSPEYKKPSMDEQRRSLSSAGLSNDLLKDGEAAIFYVLENNPNHQIDIEWKRVPFHDLTELRSRMAGQPVKLFDRFEGDYKFAHATVSFYPALYENPLTDKEEAEIADKLRKQAEESGKGYAMMPIEVSKNYWIIMSSYQRNGKTGILVTISKTPGKQTVMLPEEDKDNPRETLEVKGIRMLYTEFATGRNIQWVYDIPGSKEAVHYMIETGLQMNKDQVIKLAESYLD